MQQDTAEDVTSFLLSETNLRIRRNRLRSEALAFFRLALIARSPYRPEGLHLTHLSRAGEVIITL